MEMKKLFKVTMDYLLMGEWINLQQTAQNHQKHLSESSKVEWRMRNESVAQFPHTGDFTTNSSGNIHFKNAKHNQLIVQCYADAKVTIVNSTLEMKDLIHLICLNLLLQLSSVGCSGTMWRWREGNHGDTCCCWLTPQHGVLRHVVPGTTLQ